MDSIGLLLKESCFLEYKMKNNAPGTQYNIRLYDSVVCYQEEDSAS